MFQIKSNGNSQTERFPLFPSPYGAKCFKLYTDSYLEIYIPFPSPYGAKCFKFANKSEIRRIAAVSVPLRGKMFQIAKIGRRLRNYWKVSVPLRGKMFQIRSMPALRRVCSRFRPLTGQNVSNSRQQAGMSPKVWAFPSPYGAKCFKLNINLIVSLHPAFPSPYGAKCFKSAEAGIYILGLLCFRPLTGQNVSN